jgi:hypothetical protein
MADNKFTIIFVSAVALTALCGLLMGVLAIFGPNSQPPLIAALFDTLKYGFTVGMLSILQPARNAANSPQAVTSRINLISCWPENDADGPIYSLPLVVLKPPRSTRVASGSTRRPSSVTPRMSAGPGFRGRKRSRSACTLINSCS